MALGGSSVTGRVTQWAAQLRFPVLFFIIGFLFLIDFFTPDPLPLVDELILALLAVLLGRWKDRKRVLDVEEVPEVES